MNSPTQSLALKNFLKILNTVHTGLLAAGVDSCYNVPHVFAHLKPDWSVEILWF